MRLDKYSNPIYNSQDIINMIYQGNSPYLHDITVDIDNEFLKLENTANIKLKNPPLETLSIEEFDKICQQEWFNPQDYCPNLIEMLYGMCNTTDQRDRVSEELEAFIKHGMMDLLFYLKYLVDMLEENNIVYGVGRGSSVASYVLYLIKVHRVDSLKYNLDWREFLR